MSLRPSLQRIALSLAVAMVGTVALIDGAEAQRTSKAAASKSAPAADEKDRTLDGAAKSVEAGNADAAMSALEGVLAGGGLSNSQMARALYLRGLAHRKKGRPAQAIADLTSAVWLKDGLNEKDRASALSARSEISRDVGVPASAANEGVASEPRSTPAASVAAAPEPAAPRTRTAAAPRSMGEDLSEAGFTRSFKQSAPVAETAPTQTPPAATRAPAAAPSTSSWQSTTSTDGKERARSAEPRQQMSSATVAPPPQARPADNPPAAQPSTGGGLGSFFTGLFTGTPSASSGDTAAKAPRPPRTEAWTTTEKPAPAKASKEASSLIATSAVPSGAFRLQIATVRSRKEADTVAARVRKEYANAIGRRQLEIDQTAFGGMGTFYRVRLGPYADMKEPKSLCDQLRPKGYDCLVVTN